MLSEDSVFVGIDPTSGRGALTYAALDRDMNLLALAEGEADTIFEYLDGLPHATVAVNAPSSLNHGLLRARMQREMSTPHQIRGAEMRMAEYELRERGITVSGTPGNAALCPAWVQLGFELFRRLEERGFKEYPADAALRQSVETHPHACYCVMRGAVPLAKQSLEGRMQRQLLLHDRGVHVDDPMLFFEEITRYKLARGIWPTELLYSPEQLDALVAAFTAWCSRYKPQAVISIGDGREGRITLPVAELKHSYAEGRLTAEMR